MARRDGARRRPRARRPAHAGGTDTWPSEVLARPLALDKGMLELRGDTVEVNLSSGAIARPVSLAPSVFFGVADNMTVGVSHARISGPEGVCVTGAGNGCPHVYDNVNLEALHSVARGDLSVATHPALEFLALSPDVLVAFRVAATARYRAGAVAVAADPGVLFGFNHRGRGNATELVSVPVALELQAGAQLEAHVTSGVACSLASPACGDSFTIPLGAGLTYAATRALDFGADVILPNALGHDGGTRARVAVIRVAFRR